MNINKNIIWFLGIWVVVGGIWFAINHESIPERNVAEIDEFTKYFEQEVIAQAVAESGQPIEGFNADILRVVYPGLVPNDFQDVEANGGFYEVDDEELLFIADVNEPETSASKTVTEGGYATMLQNLSNRLKLAKTEIGINKIIDKINLAEVAELKIGENIEVMDIKISPTQVVEDSRCPVNANCVQAGTVKVRTTVTNTSDIVTYLVFNLGEVQIVDGTQVTLRDVKPQKIPAESTDASNYVFTFEFVK